MANKTENRIFLPNKTPPISPNDTGILFLVSTNNKKVYKETRAMVESKAVEKNKPPL